VVHPPLQPTVQHHHAYWLFPRTLIFLDYPEDGGRKVLRNIHAYTCTSQNDLVSQKAGIFQAVGYTRSTPLDAKGHKVTHISLPLTLPVNSFVNCSRNTRTRTAVDRA